MAGLAQKLQDVYERMLTPLGSQGWWPGETPFEVCVGAILTQNTNWGNVEKAIANLRRAGVLDFENLWRTPDAMIAELIRPSGHFNVKANRLRRFLNGVREMPGGFAGLKDLPASVLRERLLAISGIGPETADSMVLYAFAKPAFVVDAYTKRIFTRHALIPEDADYHQIQETFTANLPEDVALFNEYHALIVRIGKDFCKKGRPLCESCPLHGVNGFPRGLAGGRLELNDGTVISEDQ